ncbi:MAG: aldo/keto reductase [Fidelibacterota bacterium]|nr:MAG: aldo/keto reductase [Candidatus Neomarinimicrobiota bacterium]
METKTYRGMKYRRMGNSGLWVSEVGLGLWKWGDPSYDGSRIGEHDGFKILDCALELGATHWDTANSYNMGAGNSERLIGRYFKSRGSRARNMVVLATKVKNAVRDEHELTRDFSPNESGASRKYIIQAVEDCLKRLQTDRIDLLYHHSPSLLSDGSWETPLDETWAAFDQLVRQGKVLYLAVSNRTAAQLETESKTLATVAVNSSHRIIGVQNRYNLMDRPRVSKKEGEPTVADEREFLEYIAQMGISLVPFMPLALGLLTGRYRKGKLDDTGRLSEQAGEARRDEFLTDRNLELVDKLDAVAKRKGCSLAQLSIAWLLSHEVVCSVIAGVTKMEQLEENVISPSVSFSQEELEEVDNLTR